MTCRNCGASWRTYEEKETDVNIAASLVAPATYFVAALPPGRSSFELRRLLPDSFTIGRGRIAQAQLPSKVVDPVTKHVIERPGKWT